MPHCMGKIIDATYRIRTMNKRDREIQEYLDACQNPRIFCQGSVWTIGIATGEVPRPGPRCNERHNCPLFRQLDMRKPVKLWNGSGDDQNGCRPFKLWKLDVKQQLEEQAEWDVTMAGVKRRVNGKDPDAAAIRMFLMLRSEGFEVDKMDLLERNYLVVAVVD